VNAPASGPLSGLGVIVTRPVRQAAAIATRLATLGANPIIWPAIVIVPPEDRSALDAVHARLDAFDVAIFVSANAAEFGAPAPSRWPAGLRILAPGPGTAEALAAVGLPGAIVPTTTFDSEGLLALPQLREVAGKRIAIFRGQDGRELLGERLRARGAMVEYVACYRREAPSGDATGLIDTVRDGRAHVLTLTSVEGLDNLAGAIGPTGVARFSALKTFAPHPRIVEAARACGLDAQLTPPGDDGLVAALLQFAAARA